MKKGNAIEVKNMTKKFKLYYDKPGTLKERLVFWNHKKAETRTVLDNINLEIKKGETVALIGVNGSGKSTLVGKLRQKYKLDSLHLTDKDPTTFEFYKSLLLKTNLVTDGDFIDEMVWSEVYSRKRSLNFRKFEKLVSLSNEVGAKIIVLTTPIDVLKGNLEERTEERKEILDSYLEKIDSMYRYYAGLCNAPIVDISDMTFDQFCRLYIEGNEFVKVKNNLTSN